MGNISSNLHSEGYNSTLSNPYNDSIKKETINTIYDQEKVDTNLTSNSATSSYNHQNSEVETMDVSTNYDDTTVKEDINSNNKVSNAENINVENINDSTKNDIDYQTKNSNDVNINNNSSNSKTEINVNNNSDTTSNINNNTTSNTQNNINTNSTSSTNSNNVNYNSNSDNSMNNNSNNSSSFSQNSSSGVNNTQSNTSNISTGNNTGNNFGSPSSSQSNSKNSSQNSSATSYNSNLNSSSDVTKVVKSPEVSEKNVDIKFENNEYIEYLKMYGFIDEDIKRVINGEISVEDLILEIQNDDDNKRRKLMLEASYLNQLSLDIYNLEDFQKYIDDLKLTIEQLKEQRKILDNREYDSLLKIITRLKAGESFENVLSSEIVAWKYEDEDGNTCYVYDDPYKSLNPDNIEYVALTFEQMYGDSELLKKLKKELTEVKRKSIFGEEKSSYQWTNSINQQQFWDDFSTQYNNYVNERKEKLEIIDKKLKDLELNYNKFNYWYEYVYDEVIYYLENIDAYIHQDDFDYNTQFNENSLKVLEELEKKYKKNVENGIVNLHVEDKEDIVDLIACMINNRENLFGSQLFIDEKDSAFIFSDDEVFNHFAQWYDLMDETEIAVFNYIYNTKGYDAAYKHLESISKELDNRWLINKCQEDAEFAMEHEILASLGSIVTTPIDGIIAAIYSLQHSKIYRTDVYSPGDVWRTTVAEKLAEEHGFIPAFAYNVGMSLLDIGATVAVSAALGGGLGATVFASSFMGSKAYVSTLNSALDRGISDTDAKILAFSSAVVEIAMESYSLSNLLNLGEKIGKNTFKSVATISAKVKNEKLAKVITKSAYITAGALSQGLCEGEEELATDILNFIIDEMVSGDLSEYNIKIVEYIDLGLSEEEARKKANKEFEFQLVETFLAGLIAGIISGGISSGVAGVKKVPKRISREIMSKYESEYYPDYIEEKAFFTSIFNNNSQENELNLKRTNIREFKRLGDIAVDGTSVYDYLLNKKTKAKGYLKVTGCMVNIENEDLNEHISMKMLRDLGFKAAKTELLTLENGERGWISYDLVKENEKVIDIKFRLPAIQNQNPDYILNIGILNIEEKLRQLNIGEKEFEKLKKSYLESILVYNLFANYDYKSDNLKLVYNKELNSLDLMQYDYGTAFNENSIQRSFIFQFMNSEQIFDSLFKNYGQYVNDITKKINDTFTPEYLMKITEGLEPKYREQVVNVLINSLNLLNLSYKKYYVQNYQNNYFGKNFNKNSNITFEQSKIVNSINYEIAKGNKVVKTFFNTKALSSNMLEKISDLSKVDFQICDGFADINNVYKDKYRNEKYISRITYNGFEMVPILKKIEELEARVNPNLPKIDIVKQIYEIIASEYKYFFDFKNYENGHKIAASLRGITPNNPTGKQGLVCAGYAILFKDLCSRFNIDCEYIRGIAILNSGRKETHAWNVILIDNLEIPVDVCWGACDFKQNWFGPSEEFANRHIADKDEKYSDYRTISQIQKDFNILNSYVQLIDYKYGANAGIKRLIEYYNSNDYIYITRENNMRNLIKSISRKNIRQYIQQYINKAQRK